MSETGQKKKNQGVFTVGKTPEAAVKAAVMIEDVARLKSLPKKSTAPTAIISKSTGRHRSTLL